MMLVMNDRGLEHLLSSKFELTGEGSAAAGPVGRHASAGTDWKLNTEGAVVEQDTDATVATYGNDLPFKPPFQ